MINLHIECYSQLQSGEHDFSKWFQRFVLPSGRHADPHSQDTIHEICGQHIGDTHTPYASSSAADMGWVVVGVDIADGLLKCYAALRLSISDSTVVIDLLGVHSSIRGKGVGSLFYHTVMIKIKSKVLELIIPKTRFLIAIQSTFDHNSYVQAVANSASLVSDSGSFICVSIDKRQIASKLTGACLFWKRVGFLNLDLVYNQKANNILDPTLVMWKTEEV